MVFLGLNIGYDYTNLAVGSLKKQNDDSIEFTCEIIANEDGDRMIPSLVACTEDENGELSMIHGTPAESYYIRRPNSVVKGFRDSLGRSKDDKDSENVISPEKAMESYLNWVQSTVEGYASEKIERAVMTVPHTWTQSQRVALQKICEKIGLPLYSCLDERIAVWLANFAPSRPLTGKDYLKMSSTDEKFLIIDIGAQSTRLTAIAIHSGVPVILKFTQEDSISCSRLDELIFQHFKQEFQRKFKQDIQENPKSCRKLRKACRNVKSTLSKAHSAFVSVDSLWDGMDFHSSIHRARFELITSSMCYNLNDIIKKFIEDLKISPDEFKGLCFVGGGSKIPYFRNCLNESILSKIPSHSIDGQEDFATGALKEALMSAEFPNTSIQENLERNIHHTTLNFGLGLLREDGEMFKLVEQGCPLPMSRTFKFNKQASMVLQFFKLIYGQKPLLIKKVHVSSLPNDHHMVANLCIEGPDKVTISLSHPANHDPLIINL